MKRDLERLSNQTFDVLIIGAGIHGAIVAWDATLRGLSVALIERGDFGGGTSQNSLKIIHGGLRYLPDGKLSRIRTMVRERTTWMRIAPHLVHPLPCLTPTRKKISRSQLAMRLALASNDFLSFDRNRLKDREKYIPSGRIISTLELSRLLPGYDVRTSTGAAVWCDAQIYNSERLLLEFILSAAEAGAEIANYVDAIRFVKQNDKIIGVQVKDIPSGQVFDIRSKVTINCAGAWIDNLLGGIDVQFDYALSVAMNLIVDQVWSGIAAGLPSQPGNGTSTQILFIVPWRNKSLIGTWHIPWRKAPGEFKLKEAVIHEFLKEVNSAHPMLKLSLKDVQHVTWGFLPVNKIDMHKDQVILTRDGIVVDHQKKDAVAGLISVLGVKYTTARAVAEQAVNLAADKLAVKTKNCQTHTTPVKGGYISDFRAFLNQALLNAPRGMDEEIVEHLVYTYGSEYSPLIQEMDKLPHLMQRIDPTLPVTTAEVMQAVRKEMAFTLPDLIQRRTELGATGLPSTFTLRRCAALMGSELGWSMERQRQEVDSVVRQYPFQPTERILA
jgi:glycerol-3-phosphate dehydrogenase